MAIITRTIPALFRHRLPFSLHFLALVLILLAATAPAQQIAHQTQLPPHPSASLPATLQGSITNADGAVYEGVLITLSQPTAPDRTATTDSNGHFRFTGLLSGPYTLTVTSGGFTARQLTGSLAPGQDAQLPAIVLAMATATSEVRVTSESRIEVAQMELHEEEQQHVLAVIPNFYVVYDPNAPPLTPHQKFHLAWRNEIDPFGILITGAAAGIEQAEGDFKGYGEGAQGYGKRFGAAYADDFIGNMLGGAILPSLFHQDPRYFWKGSGTKKSRVLYAIANSVICKGDNGHWQFNYSGILGGVASASISNLYYPAADRNGVSLTVENTGLGILGSAVGNIFQEFVARHFTPGTKSAKP